MTAHTLFRCYALLLVMTFSGCDQAEDYGPSVNARRAAVGLQPIPEGWSEQTSSQYDNRVVWRGDQRQPGYYKKIVVLDDNRKHVLAEYDCYFSGVIISDSIGLPEEIMCQFSWEVHANGGMPWKYTYIAFGGEQILTQKDAFKLLKKWGFSPPEPAD